MTTQPLSDSSDVARFEVRRSVAEVPVPVWSRLVGAADSHEQVTEVIKTLIIPRVHGEGTLPIGNSLVKVSALGRDDREAVVRSRSVRIDPQSFKAAQEVVRYPANEVFSVSTVALQVGKEIWLGSVRGDRVARYPLP